MPPGKRKDAETCSKVCRQARHRFGAKVPRLDASPGSAMRFAYADPPYPGMAARSYAEHPDFAGEALSTESRSLRDVLPLCPLGVRVAAWHRGERPTRSEWPLAAWEPVIYFRGRPTMREPQERRIDLLRYHANPRRTDSRRVVGAKPATFCYWLFDLLGALPGDELVDIFPGSGGVARAWAKLYESRQPSRRDGSTDWLPLESATAKASRAAGAARPVEVGQPSGRSAATRRPHQVATT